MSTICVETQSIRQTSSIPVLVHSPDNETVTRRKTFEVPGSSGTRILKVQVSPYEERVGFPVTKGSGSVVSIALVVLHRSLPLVSTVCPLSSLSITVSRLYIEKGGRKR